MMISKLLTCEAYADEYAMHSFHFDYFENIDLYHKEDQESTMLISVLRKFRVFQLNKFTFNGNFAVSYCVLLKMIYTKDYQRKIS